MKIKFALATLAISLAAAGSAFAGSPTATAPNLNGVTSITITSGYANNSSLWYLQVAELVATQTGTGVDVALTGTGSALNQYVASTGPEKANDGVLSTDYTTTPGYHSLGTPNDYYTLTFGGPVDLSSITIYGRTDTPPAGQARDLYDVTVVSGATQQSFVLDGTTVAGGAVSISAAPEPAVWMLMFAGIAALGGALRFRRRQGAAVAAA